MTAVIDPNTSDSQLIMLLTESRAQVRDLTEQLATKKAKAEEHMMQQVACGTAALSNTRQTAAERIPKDHPYWTAAYKDVCDTVDREMDLREQLDAEKARADKWKSENEANNDAIIEIRGVLQGTAGECVAFVDDAVRAAVAEPTKQLTAALVKEGRLREIAVRLAQVVCDVTDGGCSDSCLDDCDHKRWRGLLAEYEALTQPPGRGAINYEGTQEIVGVVMKKLRKSLDDTAKSSTPICARCYHKATAHAVDDEELRECTESDCVCGEYLDAAKEGR